VFRLFAFCSNRPLLSRPTNNICFFFSPFSPPQWPHSPFPSLFLLRRPERLAPHSRPFFCLGCPQKTAFLAFAFLRLRAPFPLPSKGNCPSEDRGSFPIFYPSFFFNGPVVRFFSPPPPRFPASFFDYPPFFDFFGLFPPFSDSRGPRVGILRHPFLIGGPPRAVQVVKGTVFASCFFRKLSSALLGVPLDVWTFFFFNLSF